MVATESFVVVDIGSVLLFVHCGQVTLSVEAGVHVILESVHVILLESLQVTLFGDEVVHVSLFVHDPLLVHVALLVEVVHVMLFVEAADHVALFVQEFVHVILSVDDEVHVMLLAVQLFMEEEEVVHVTLLVAVQVTLLLAVDDHVILSVHIPLSV